jgi:drug/metabolite transporter (DMT)-like permease
MLIVLGVAAAASLGLGWVLQQRVAAHAALSELLSWRLLLHLMHKRVWWLGILAMIAGQTLGALALQSGPVALVEPLLSANLLFAFLIASWTGRQPVRWLEILGALLLCAALGVFIAVGSPTARHHPPRPDDVTVALAAGVTGLVVALVVAVAKRQKTLAAESVLIACGAGLLYGLQDVATRASLQRIGQDGLVASLVSPWFAVVIAAAAVGLLLSQSAFRAARLDYSLPPTTAAEPVAGIALGITVLGDHLSTGPGELAVEVLCLLAMVGGVVLIGRSSALSRSIHEHHEQHLHHQKR